MKQDPGTLLHLYANEVSHNQEINQALVNQYKTQIQQSGRNWVPVVVIQTGAETFDVINGAEILEACNQLGIHKVWCIIADETALNWAPNAEPTTEPVAEPEPAKRTYRQMQAALKEYKKQGHKVTCKLNASAKVLQKALEAIEG